MSDLLVTLDVLTGLATVAEITAALGIEPSRGQSHDKGSPRLGGVRERTVWRLASPVARSAPLAEHAEALLASFETLQPQAIPALPPDTEIQLNVGVLSHGETDAITLPCHLLRRMADLRLSLEASFYVCSDEEDDA